MTAARWRGRSDSVAAPELSAGRILGKAARPGGGTTSPSVRTQSPADLPKADAVLEQTRGPCAKVLRQAGLKLGSADALSIRRRRCGSGFIYLDEDGRRIVDADVLSRIRALAIPPNYRDVRIAASAKAHLQAVGTDEAGRTQYRYHPRWEDVREDSKVDRLAAIARCIGRIRRRIRRDMRRPVGSRRKAAATLVMLLDRTHIRIGSEDYVHSGRSRGAATLLKRNVTVSGAELKLRFPAKGGRMFECALRAPALARAVSELCELPGRRLFQYRDAHGRRRHLTSTEANAYLRGIAGAPVTAKDFRTLAATADAACRLAEMEPAEKPTHRRRQIAGVVREVSVLLGNTPAVARKSYVHRELVRAFEDGRLAELAARAVRSGRGNIGEDLVAELLARRP
jgi:DNA topoisomerase I